MSPPIINLEQWFESPAGRHLQAWELARCDQALNRCFGYHALQVGAPFLPLLRSSRIQHNWTAATLADSPDDSRAPSPPSATAPTSALALHATALPFAQASMDLVLLPHTLETSSDPHATLREAARILVPEGHLLVFGFSPSSLWGMQHKLRRMGQRLGARSAARIPGIHTLVGTRQLRDWLSLLGLEIEEGCFGSYRPMLAHPAWFKRLQWLEAAGDRWWPFLGNVYFLLATKRVRGMRALPSRWQLAVDATGNAVAPIQRAPMRRAPDLAANHMHPPSTHTEKAPCKP